MNSNGEDVIIKCHKQDRVLINIVNSTMEDVIIRGYKQDRVAIIIMNSNGKGAIIMGHKHDIVLNAIISSKQVKAVISDKVDTIYSCKEPMSHLSSMQVMFIICNTVHSCSKLAGRLRKVMVIGMWTSTTTLGWRLATTTSTNRSLLFLVGEGHHW